MLKVSDTAAEKAKEILKAEGKESWGLRVFIHGAGCCGPSYGMDIDENAKEGDETVEKNGLKVFVDKEASASLSNKEIAARLFITSHTAKLHTLHIYQKLQVSTRYDAVTKAQSLGLLSNH